jgi:hypothetical protein
MILRTTWVGILLCVSCHAPPSTDVGTRNAAGMVPVTPTAVLADGGDAATIAWADAAGDAGAPPEPPTAPLGCAAASQVPGTEWVEESRATQSKNTGCGGNLPWLGHVFMTKKILAVDEGGVRDLRVRYEVVRDSHDDKLELEGRSLRFARTLAGPTIIDEGGVALPGWARDEMSIDGAEVSDALPWPIPTRELKRGELVSTLGPSVLALLTRSPVATLPKETGADYPQTLTATVRFEGQVAKDWGTARVFKAQVVASLGGAGMCHHWTSSWRIDGTLAFPPHADTLIEAHLHGTLETKEGLCQGCGKDRQRACPEVACGRGTFESTLSVRCAAATSP